MTMIWTTLTRARKSPDAVQAGLILYLRDIAKEFGGVSALSDVSLKIERGERVGIMGPNGAGKTTLTKVITGELKPDRGKVYFAGLNVTNMPTHRRFIAGIGKTNQIARPFRSMTVIDAVALGALAFGAGVREARERSYEALSALQLGRIAGRPMAEVNVVESRLVELAKIMTSRCELVLLDELLAGLPESEVPYVMGIVTSCAEQAHWTVVMVEHLLGPLTEFCPRIVALDSGRIVAEGSGETVLACDAVREAYIGK